MERLLLFGDAHLMSNPSDLSEQEQRVQWQPTLTKRLPKAWRTKILQAGREASLRALSTLRGHAAQHRCDMLVTMGDQCHGIGDRGLESDAAAHTANEFLEFCRGTTKRGPLFHVPSEHLLGYWEGADYYPTIRWRNGRPRVNLREVRREIGGGMNPRAIENWRRVFGPLWGVRDVEGFRLVWVDYDLIRWQERFRVTDNKEMLGLYDEQKAFLRKTLDESAPQSVILFSHRPDAAFQSVEIYSHHDRLFAVIFGDLHTSDRAHRHLERFPYRTFHWWFVPALCGLFFGYGPAGYAVLTINQHLARFRTCDLHLPPD